MCDSGTRYAIKQVLQDNLWNDALLNASTSHLALEAKYLKALDHPNIIKMHAEANTSPLEDEYFIVLDRLYGTLDDQLKKWKHEKNSLWRRATLSTNLQIQRLKHCCSLASAMKYLHGKSIIHRDLKPQNIGFDVRGDLKIFDFGSARDLAGSKKNDDETYNLTGLTGSLRYMAPEVIKSEPYNSSADVFSFAIIFWQIMSLKKPFKKFDVKLHNEHVVQRGYCPTCCKTWPKQWTNLMRESWSPHLKMRPTFNGIHQNLREETFKLSSHEKVFNHPF